MLTALHITFRALFWILVGLGLGLIILLGRLSAGPVALDWLQPRIEQALTPKSGDVEVAAERVELRLNPDRRSLELIGVGVHYRAADAAHGEEPSFLTFPEVELTLSVEAFLKHGLIAASHITARAPSLVVIRNEDGNIGLYSESDEGRPDDRDFGSFLRQFVAASDEDLRLSFLKWLQISGGRLAYYDQGQSTALTAQDAALLLTRHASGVEGSFRADVLQPSGGRAKLYLKGQMDPESGRVAFQAETIDLMPSDIAALWPFDPEQIPAELAGFRLPVKASIDGEMDRDGGFSPLAFELQAQQGIVDLPDILAEPIKVETAEFKGAIAPDFKALEIERLNLQAVGSQHRVASLQGVGVVAWREEDRRLALDLAFGNVQSSDLPGFWPANVGGRVKKWFVENVRQGVITEGEARIDLGSSDFGQRPLRREAIQGSFAFNDLDVRYIKEMPSLAEAAGKVNFDATRMDFAIDGGTSAGLSLEKGSLKITGIGNPEVSRTELQAVVDVQGRIDEALVLLDHPPLELAKKLSIEPGNASGLFKTRVELRMPLRPNVKKEDAVLIANADLSDFGLENLPKLGDDVEIREGQLKLLVDEEIVTLAGSLRVDDIPLDIKIIEPRDKASDQRRRIDLEGRIEVASLALPEAAAGSLEGAVDVKAQVTETDTQFWIDLEANLDALAMTPPGINWEKPAGDTGVLYASIAMPFEGPIEIKQFNLEAGDLNIAGAINLSSSGQPFDLIELSKVRLGETNAAVRILPEGDGGLEIVVEAAMLDLDALFGEQRDIDRKFERFHTVLRADRLRARGLDLNDVEADARHVSKGWRTASVIGTLASGSKLALELSPDGEARRLEFRSEDAGALIQALDLGQRVEGGRVLLTVNLPSDEGAPKEGRLDVEDFLLRDAPLLARMLTLASLTGIGNLLGGEGIQMDHLIMPFTQAGQKLTVTDGLLRGSQLGITSKGEIDLDNGSLDLVGTIIPLYSLNRLIGQVPILGRILTGTDGRGAFAATYSIDGPRGNPAVYVNPLSLVTPGLVRDLVGGILNGTLKPPEERETDN